jgi:hypothetical protein
MLAISSEDLFQSGHNRKPSCVSQPPNRKVPDGRRSNRSRERQLAREFPRHRHDRLSSGRRVRREPVRIEQECLGGTTTCYADIRSCPQLNRPANRQALPASGCEKSQAELVDPVLQAPPERAAPSFRHRFAPVRHDRRQPRWFSSFRLISRSSGASHGQMTKTKNHIIVMSGLLDILSCSCMTAA